MFEQAFRNIDDVLWKEAGCTTELDYTEQTSWLLFLKYLDGLEQDKAAEAALGKAHITVNKNAVPNDPQKPFVTSGLRIGTPAVTTRGYKEPDCVALANWICDVLDNPNDDNVIAGVRDNVTMQCKQFPVYG